MVNDQDLKFLRNTLSGLEDFIDRIDKEAQRLNLESSLVYQEVVDGFEVLKESIMEKIEELEE